MTFRSLILCIMAVVVSLPVQALPLPRYGLFVFSNLCSEHESGDVDGGRLILVRVPGSDSARVSYTGEGGLDEAPAQDVQIGKDGRISLRYLSQYDPVSGRSNVYVTVTGTVSAEAFEQIGKDSRPFRTPRVEPSQAIPECR